MTFRTKLPFTDRQVDQYEKTEINLSGASSFGIAFSALTAGVDSSSSATTDEVLGIISTYSGNTGTTVFTWGDSRMTLADNSFSALTSANSGETQEVVDLYTVTSSTVLDGNTVNLEYTGVTFDISVNDMVESAGTFSGSLTTIALFVLSAGTTDFKERTIWVDNAEITRTNKLIVSNNAVAGYVLTSDYEGMATWQAASGGTSGGTSGTNGAFTSTTVNNRIQPTVSVGNSTLSDYSSILGGTGNSINSTTEYSSIVGGNDNVLSATSFSVIGGGLGNIITANHSFIGTGGFIGYTGYENKIHGDFSSIVGGYSNIIGYISGTNCRSFIGGGAYNTTTNAQRAVIGGGGNNNISNNDNSTIAGGLSNTAGENDGIFIGGGNTNLVSGFTSIIVGGEGNTITINGSRSFIGGGKSNTVTSNSSSIIGGSGNTTNHENSHIIGTNLTTVSANTTHVEDLLIDGLTSVSDLQTNSDGVLINGVSDITFKTKVEPIENALDIILKLNPVSFEWKPEIKLREGTIYGLIAQDVQDIIPDIVTERSKGNGTLTLEYKEIIPWLIGAVQELADKKDVTVENMTVLNTQTISAEDNNIELNYGGNHDTAIAGGISVIDGVDNGESSHLKTNKEGWWVATPGFIPQQFIAPKYSPLSSDDVEGKTGELTWDDEHIYIKTANGWRRSNLEKF